MTGRIYNADFPKNCSRCINRIRSWSRERIRNQAFWNGSYTVEAAAVVSLTILILSALLMAAFYAHDRAVLQGVACENAVLGSIYATDSERNKAAASAKSRVSASGFLGSRDISGSVTVGDDTAEASWSAVFPVPGFAMQYLADSELSLQASWSSRIAEPADTIRLIRGAGKLLGTEGEKTK